MHFKFWMDKLFSFAVFSLLLYADILNIGKTARWLKGTDDHHVSQSAMETGFFLFIISVIAAVILAVVLIRILFGASPRLLVKKIPAIPWDSNFYDYQGDQPRVLLRGNEVLRFLAKPEYYWRWDKNIGNLRVMSIETWEKIEMSLQPITNNPKVRNLSYAVSILLDTGNLPALQALVDSEKSQSWGNEIKSQLYEINNGCSSEMSEFYNPLDQDQQARFRALIERELGPTLAPGLKITKVQFSLN